MDKVKNIKVGYIILLVTSLIFLLFPFAVPIFFAGTIALTLQTPLTYLISKGLKRKHASALLTLLFALVVSLPLLFFLIQGTLSVTAKLEKFSLSGKLPGEGFKEMLSGFRHDFVELVQRHSSKFHLDFLSDKKIEEYFTLGSTFLLNFLRDFLTSLPSVLVLFLVMILCTYSFLNHAHRIRSFFQELLGLPDHKMNHLVHIFVMNSRQVYLSNIITGGIQSLFVALGVSLLGLGDFLTVYFVTLILSFIPVIGAAPVAFLFSLLAFLKGQSMPAFILLVLGSITGVVDNFLRPWLATLGESRIPPIVAFMCVIGGALLLGFPGLFIGLLIGSIAFDTVPFFWRELKIHKKL